MEEVKTRFTREAETVVRLTHPNIVTIYDVDVGQDRACIAMEFLNSHDLKRYIRSNRLLSVKLMPSR